jgi:hypothetical protein
VEGRERGAVAGADAERARIRGSGAGAPLRVEAAPTRARTTDSPIPSLSRIRHHPDFAAIRDRRRWGKNAKVHDEHLRAAESYVDGLVEAVRHKDRSLHRRAGRRRAGVGDKVAHHPAIPVNAGYLKTVQARCPGARGDGAGLGDEDIAHEAESPRTRKIEHIGRGVQFNFREGRLDR